MTTTEAAQAAAREDRALGCFLGLAVGDAVGTTVEFRPRGSFPPVTDMVGGGPFRLRAGQWTDDTSMALCLAESLLAEPVVRLWPPRIQALAQGCWRGLRMGQLRSSGYVVHTLTAALWCATRARNFEEAVLMAANLGDDADTVAAVTGQIAGAMHGESGILPAMAQKAA